MAEQITSITWEAYEHTHLKRNGDWFWVLGIFTLAGSAASILLGNVLLGLVILIGGGVGLILGTREPKLIPYAVTMRGLRIDNKLYPYSTLESFYIDEEEPAGPQLLARSEKMLTPLIVMPLPEEHIHDIENIIAERLPEEFLEEPLAHKVLEFFGF